MDNLAPVLSVIVPIYREADVIASFLENLRSQLDSLDDSYEVIVVVDGDDDKSTEVLSKINWSSLIVFVNEINSGKGFSIRKGIESARATKFISFIDGDSDINPRGIIDGIKTISANFDLDFVYGSKLHPRSKIDYPIFRKLQSWLFAKIVLSLFSLKTMDTQTGLKIGRSHVMTKIIAETKLSGFAFDVEFFSLAESYGFSHSPLPVEVNLASQSNVKLRQSLTAVKDLFKIRSQMKKRFHQRATF